MTEVVAAPEAFKALVAKYSPRNVCSVIDDWALPPPPAHLKHLAWTSNSDLVTHRRPNIEALKTAASDLARTCGDRPGWYDMTLAIAGDVARWPEMRAELCALFHQISALAPSYGNHAFGVYPRTENEVALDDAIAQAEKRLARGETIRTTASLLAVTGANDNVELASEATAENVSTLVHAAPRIPGASYGDCIAATPYKRKPIFSTSLFIGEITLLSGTGGTAKSTWATGIATALATGQPLFASNLHIRRVVSINLEDSIGEVTLRFNAVEKYHGLQRDALASNLHLIGAEDAHLFALVESDGRGGNCIREEGFNVLRQVVEHHRAELVILDPLVLLLSGGQNDGNLVGQVQRRLKALATELGFAILMVAHTRKGSNALTDGADATAGSAALTNLARVGLGIVNVDAKRAQTLGIMPGDERRYREVVNTKANLAPIQDGLIFEIVSIGMGNGTPDFPDEDKVAVAVHYVPPPPGTSRFSQQLERDVLVAIANGINGQPLSPTSKGARAHHIVCAGAVAPHHPSKSQDEWEAIAKAVVTDLLRLGWVKTIQTTTSKSSGGKNPAKGLLVLWSNTPWAHDPKPGQFAT